ncbi:MAG: GIY-YIG nuclease family protein [Patescibacteria group bacterium]
MKFLVYAIYNKNRDKIYIGHTSDLDSRIERHNGVLKNKSKSFTHRNSGKWDLVYSEEFETRIESINRERELKSFRGREFVRSLIKEE